MHKFNIADKVLGATFVLFGVALFVQVLLPENVFAKGFLFCSEAALVGGIADWFAVTALFKKPLGFPWHTALLPRKRRVFTDSCVNLVKHQFFSRSNVLKKIRKLRLSVRLFDYCTGPEVLKKAADFLITCAAKELPHLSLSDLPKSLLFQLGDEAYAKDIFTKRICAFLVEEKNVRPAFDYLVAYLNDYLASEAGHDKIEGLLEDLQREKAGNGIASLMISLGNAFNVINIDEATELLQAKLQKLLSDAAMAQDGDLMVLRQKIISQTILLLSSEEAETIFCEIWQRTLKSEECARAINEFIEQNRQIVIADFASDGPLCASLRKAIGVALLQAADAMKNDAALAKNVDELLCDAINRAALQAQDMIEGIIRQAIGSLSDEQLNEMVYGKVEQDLNRIRLNGSIVGTVIGLGLFIVMHFFE